MTVVPHPVDSMAELDQLSEALDRIGDALVNVDGDAMLAADPPLLNALTVLTAASAPPDQAAAKALCERAGTALLRCRRLGASFSRGARVFSAVGAPADHYDKSGAYVDGAALRAALQVRI